jgi:hypothetical protein
MLRSKEIVWLPPHGRDGERRASIRSYPALGRATAGMIQPRSEPCTSDTNTSTSCSNGFGSGANQHIFPHDPWTHLRHHGVEARPYLETRSTQQQRISASEQNYRSPCRQLDSSHCGNETRDRASPEGSGHHALKRLGRGGRGSDPPVPRSNNGRATRSNVGERPRASRIVAP